MGNSASIAFDRLRDVREIEYEYPSVGRIAITVLSIISILMFTSVIRALIDYLIVTDVMRIYVLLIILFCSLLLIAMFDRICNAQVEKRRMEREAELKFGSIVQ
jgi:hypothetical protein